MNPSIHILSTNFEDLKEILALQKQTYRSEAELIEDYSIQPLIQPTDMNYLQDKKADEIAISIKSLGIQFLWKNKYPKSFHLFILKNITGNNLSISGG